MPLLQRYISSELTHFVGRSLPDAEQQFGLFGKILAEGLLLHPPFDLAAGTSLSTNPDGKFSKNDVFNEQVVCFCDIPEPDLGIHITKYSPFGIAFSRDFVVTQGANPVFYIAKNSAVRVPADLTIPGRLEQAHADILRNPLDPVTDSSTRAKHFDEMLEEAFEVLLRLEELFLRPLEGDVNKLADLPHRELLGRLLDVKRFLLFYVFSFMKSFDDRKKEDDQDNYYMEREWRLVGNLKFSLDDVSRVLLPKEFADRFRQKFPTYYGQISFV